LSDSRVVLGSVLAKVPVPQVHDIGKEPVATQPVSAHLSRDHDH